jgi:hypothetical protein
MALVSILLSVVALLCTAIGFFTTPIPVLGTVFSFGAAAIALLGVVLGGRAVSAAKRQGRTNDTARIGVISNALALVPALLVALTCGVCNALFSSGNVQVQRDFQFNGGTWEPDAGPNALPPPQRQPGLPGFQGQAPGEPPPGAPAQPTEPTPGAPDSPTAQPNQAAQPSATPRPGADGPHQIAPSPATLPPPPLPAGPGK